MWRALLWCGFIVVWFPSLSGAIGTSAPSFMQNMPFRTYGGDGRFDRSPLDFTSHTYLHTNPYWSVIGGYKEIVRFMNRHQFQRHERVGSSKGTTWLGSCHHSSWEVLAVCP